MEKIENKTFTGERALFKKSDLSIESCTFKDGESHLKEGKNFEIRFSTFQWKYPLWYCTDVKVEDACFASTARAGIWYTGNAYFKSCRMDCPKAFRKCENLSLTDIEFTDASETLWNCRKVNLKNVKAKGDYFAMNLKDAEISSLHLDGNYPFDGSKNVVIRDSVLNSKDAFWNSENITLINCQIEGEYFAWNTTNLTMIDCKLTSLQGLCYIKNITIRNCNLEGVDLSFEYCENIDAEINSRIISIKNPISGKITCKGVSEIILDDDSIDHSKTTIEVRDE